MNKYLGVCLLSLATTPAIADFSGLYITVGGGAGFVDYQSIDSFNLDYVTQYNHIFSNDELNESVLANFNNSAQYDDNTKDVAAGRIAIGYLWEFFDDDDDRMFADTLIGFEFGYRLFDNFSTSATEVVQDTSHPLSNNSNCHTDTGQPCFFVSETATDTIQNQAIDLSAVGRIPFTEDNAFALLLKAGVAYNLYEIDRSIEIKADTNNPPNQPIPYNRTVKDTVEHDEFLPVFGAGLEYMMFEGFGVSAEYSAIVGSDDHTNNQLVIANLVFRP